MSHVVQVQITVKDLDALEVAAGKVGLEMHRGQTKYKWYGRSVGDYPIPEGMKESDLGKCTHALSVMGNKNAYEIGILEQKDGTYKLVWDFWSGGYGLKDKVGADCTKLIEEYALAVAKSKCDELGWMSERNDAGLLVYHPAGGTLQISKGGEIDAMGFIGKSCDSAVDTLSQALGNETSRFCKPERNVLLNENKQVG